MAISRRPKSSGNLSAQNHTTFTLFVKVAAFAGVDDRRLDGRRCQGAQNRPESRHAGHSMDARRRCRGMVGVHRVYPNCEIGWTK